MIRPLRITVLAISIFTFGFVAGQEANLPDDFLTMEFHQGRRNALRTIMPPNSVAVFFANPIRSRANDGLYKYHQDPNFYYLTGHREPHAVLFIFKEDQEIGNGSGAGAYNEIIFVRQHDALKELYDGARLGKEGANEKLNARIEDIATSTGETERAEALEGFLNTLRGSQDLTGAEVDPLALGGQRFAERVGAGEAVTRQAGTERAGRLSTIGAAGEQRRRETGRVADTASALSEIERQSQAKDFITRLRIASKRPNPLVNALGTTLQGAGSVVALGGGGGGANLDKLFAKGGLVDPAITGTPILPQFGAPPPIFAA